MRACILVLLVASLAACRSRAAPDDAGPALVAATDKGAPKKPPPLRAARVVTPPLPDLPALEAHDAPSPPPPTADLDGHPCKAVWTGSQTAALACAHALMFGADKDSAAGAKLVVPRALLARDPSTVPAVVDHRLEGTEGPTRNQGQTPACTAFATATALDHALARWGTHVASSTMQIWSRYHSPRVETSLVSNLGAGVGAEQAWPFDAREATRWVPCGDLVKPKAGTCGLPVDAARVQKLEASPIGELTEVEYLGVPPDTQTLVTTIAAGQDVLVAMELPTSFVPKGKAGARYVPHYTKSGGPDAGHALVLAGYARLPHGTYFLAHNSWGAGWGDGGYAWMHEATLRAWAHEVVAIDAEPVGRDANARPRRDRGTTTCAVGLVPDSIRATCAAPCPDGSPRHDDVCAIAGQCAAGYVNLAGACVLAAPTAHGSDRSSGVGWACGPGGCAYTLPRTIDPTCTGNVCQASCPAPDFRIAKMGKEMVCVE